MNAFTSKTIQQIRRLIIILGGLTFLAIPFAMILLGTAFIVIPVGLGFLFAENVDSYPSANQLFPTLQSKGWRLLLQKKYAKTDGVYVYSNGS